MKIIFIFIALASLDCWAYFGNPDNPTFAVIGDAGNWNSKAKSVQESIFSQNVKNLILPGDNLYVSTYSKIWGHWQSRGFDFSVVAIGNHNAGYQNEMQYFKMPGEYYSVNADENTKFIVLNSDNPNNVKIQATWLDHELQNSSEEIIFVVFHHPPFTISSIHSWEEKKSFHLAVRPILAKYSDKISALILGHDHEASFYLFNGIPAIVSGAVWETRVPSKISNIQSGWKVESKWQYDVTPYWVRMEIDKAHLITRVDFIRAKDNAFQCSVLLDRKQIQMGSNCVDKDPSSELRL